MHNLKSLVGPGICCFALKVVSHVGLKRILVLVREVSSNFVGLFVVKLTNEFDYSQFVASTALNFSSQITQGLPPDLLLSRWYYTNFEIWDWESQTTTNLKVEVKFDYQNTISNITVIVNVLRAVILRCSIESQARAQANPDKSAHEDLVIGSMTQWVV